MRIKGSGVWALLALAVLFGAAAWTAEPKAPQDGALLGSGTKDSGMLVNDIESGGIIANLPLEQGAIPAAASGIAIAQDEKLPAIKMRAKPIRTERTPRTQKPGFLPTGELFYPEFPWYPFALAPPFGVEVDPGAPWMVYAGSARIVAKPGEPAPPIPQELKVQGETGSVPGYYIVHFQGEIQSEWNEKILKAGALPTHNYLAHNALIYYITPEVFRAVTSIPEVDWVGLYEPAYKLSPMIGHVAKDPVRYREDGTSGFILTLFGGVNPDGLTSRINQAGFSVHADESSMKEASEGRHPYLAWTVPVSGPYHALLDLARIPEVQFISERPEVKLHKVHSAGAILQSGDNGPWSLLSNGADPPYIQSFYPLWWRGLEGQHQVVAVSDSGIDYTDKESAAGEADWGMSEMFAYPVQATQAIATPDTNMTDKVPKHANHDGSTSGCDMEGHGTGVAASCCQDWLSRDDQYVYRYNPGDMGLMSEAIAHEAQLLIGTNGGWLTFNTTQQGNQFRQLADWGASVLNSSWGWCDGKSFNYTDEALLYDQVMNQREMMLISCAGGNDGNCPTFDTLADCSGTNWAKNPLHVGASFDSTLYDSMVYMTQWNGPFTNGSNKGPNWVNPPGTGATKIIFPEVVATGMDYFYEGTSAAIQTDGTDGTPPAACNVADEDWYFGLFGGTSGASPTVAGAVALVHQYFEEGNYPGIADPSAALMKAMIVNSTDGMHATCSASGRPGGDQGWGRPNLSNVLDFDTYPQSPFNLYCVDVLNSSGQAFTASGQYKDYVVEIYDTSQPLKITLAWLDWTATVGNPRGSLAYNLNLTLTKGGTTYYGNNFDTYYGVSTTSTTAADGVNVIENIFLAPSQVAALGTGQATIRVTMASAPTARNQGFGLVAVGGIGATGQRYAKLSQERYWCNESVSGIIYDAGGVPTGIYYNSTTGGAVAATISGSGPSYTVNPMTLSQIGAAGGDDVWISFTGSDAVVYESAHAWYFCSIKVCVSSIAALSDGCDDDEFHDSGEVLNYYVTIRNAQSFDLPGAFEATLALRTPDANVTIETPTALFAPLPGTMYGTGVFRVKYTGPLTNCSAPGTMPQLNFTVENIHDIQGRWVADATWCLANGYLTDFDKWANRDPDTYGTPLWSEGFESAVPPSGWSQVILEDPGTDPAWSRVTATGAGGSPPSCTPHGGTYMGSFNSYDCPSGAQARLQRDTYTDLSGQTGAALRFWMFHNNRYTTSLDSVQVQISEGAGGTWTNVGSLFTRPGSNAWTQHAVDISAYCGAGHTQVKVGFLATSKYGDNVVIDDADIVPLVKHCEASTCSPSPAFVYFDNILNDINCNQNLYLDPGENGELYLYIRNSGNETAKGVTATLSCPTCPGGWGSITDSTAAYGDIPTDGDAYTALDDTFAISLATGLACTTSLPFVVALSGTNFTTTNVNASITVGEYGVQKHFEEHFTTEPETAGAGGRVGFTTAWTVSVSNGDANIITTDDSLCDNADTDGSQCEMNTGGSAGARTLTHTFTTAGIPLDASDPYPLWMYWEWDIGAFRNTNSNLLEFNSNGTWYTLVDDPGSNAGLGDWQCWSGDLYTTCSGNAAIPQAACDAMFNNASLQLRLAGRALKNATGSVFDNLWMDWYGMTCAATSCTGTSLVEPPPVPNGDDISGTPLKLAKNSGTSANVDVTWGTECTSSDYALFWGDLASLMEYGATTYGAVDPLLTTCSLGNTGSSTNKTAPQPSSGRCYFAVVAAKENNLIGRFGNNSNGEERELAGAESACTGLSKSTNRSTCARSESNTPRPIMIPRSVPTNRTIRFQDKSVPLHKCNVSERPDSQLAPPAGKDAEAR